MAAPIESVQLFLADRTGQDRFRKRDGGSVRVNPPRRWLEDADREGGYGGKLLDWVDRQGTIQRFETFANGDQFRAFVQNEHPGRELKYHSCQTATISYSLVVVVGRAQDAPPGLAC